MGEDEIRKGLRERDHVDPIGGALGAAWSILQGYLFPVVKGISDIVGAVHEEASIPHPYVVDAYSGNGELDPVVYQAVREHLIEISSIPTDQYGAYFDGKLIFPEMSRHFADINHAAQALGMTDMEFVASIHDRTEQPAAGVDDVVDHRTTEQRQRQRQAVVRRARQTAIYNEQIDQHWNRVLGLLPGGMGLDVESDLGNAPPKEPTRDSRSGLFDDLEANLGLVQNVAKTPEPVTGNRSFRDALEIAVEKMAAAGTYSRSTDHRGGIFESVEDDLGLMSDTVSRAVSATADPANPWASYRAQGQVPRVRSDELGHGLWDLEDRQAHTRDWTSGLPAAAVGGELARAPNFALMAQGAADAASFELWEMENPMLGIRGGAPVPIQAMGGGLAQAANSALRMQDAVGDASLELWELEHPLLRTRDGALGLAEAMGDGYGGDGVTGAMDGAGLAADGLALSTGTAEQALLAAGLTGDSTTQVLDLMRRAGLDPATLAWDELAAAVHVWGDATDTEVTRVISRLGDLARTHASAGSGSSSSGGSTGGGGTDDRTPRGLDQLMALAQAVARTRADMGDLHPQHIAHELGKLPGQLRGPGSLEEQLALLRLFFAGSAHGIAFGLGPSADRLGFNIPQFAEGGVVPGPLGAPQLIMAHGGEHIVPHRATGSPTIIRIELDREVLAQAVLGDLLRLQGREVTLGLS